MVFSGGAIGKEFVEKGLEVLFELRVEVSGVSVELLFVSGDSVEEKVVAFGGEGGFEFFGCTGAVELKGVFVSVSTGFLPLGVVGAFCF
ncbi:MAG: hypothetical protein K940chlam9_01543 [Chlamydiae bacterium]|nr:hypothetical protein [Chlamydiota bacterium]